MEWLTITEGRSTLEVMSNSSTLYLTVDENTGGDRRSDESGITLSVSQVRELRNWLELWLMRRA